MSHAGGDEPNVEAVTIARVVVCPTQVGMNRTVNAVDNTVNVCPTQVGMNRGRHGNG